MLYGILTRTRVALLLATLIFAACSDDDQPNQTPNDPNNPENPNNPGNPENPDPLNLHYTRGWTLDVKEHIGIPEEEIKNIGYLPLDCAPLKNGAIAVSAWHTANSRLLEVDAQTGQVQYKITPGALQYIDGLLLRSDGSIVVTGARDANVFSRGRYNQDDHTIESVATIDARATVLPRLVGITTQSTEQYYYAFGGDATLWHMFKWRDDGQPLWDVSIDQAAEWSTAGGTTAPLRYTHACWMDDDYSWAATSAKNDNTKLTMLYKFDKDGAVEVAKKFPTPGDDNLYLLAVDGNRAGDVFLASHTEVTKLDSDGNVRWKRTFPVGPMQTSFITLKATSDRGVLICYGDGSRSWLVRLDTAGKKTWETEYWEKNERVFLYEIPDDNLLTLSTRGIATKYTLQK